MGAFAYAILLPLIIYHFILFCLKSPMVLSLQLRFWQHPRAFVGWVFDCGT